MRIVQACDFQRKNAIAIGTFDGLHKAHQRVLEVLKQEAARIGGGSMVFTFYGLPSAFFGEEKQALFTKEEKIRAFAETGIDYLHIVEFDKCFAEISKEAFLQYLLQKLRAGMIIVGYNFRFGAGASGTPEFLQEHAAGYDVRIRVVDAVTLYGQPISSSRIREALRAGDVLLAKELLGRPYSMEGLVQKGACFGRTIGFPTANIAVPEKKLLPQRGVYLTQAEYRGAFYPSITNIGIRPTVSSTRKVTVETHILGFCGDIYGKMLRIRVLHRMREEKQFCDAAALRRQLEKDKAYATGYFGKKGCFPA